MMSLFCLRSQPKEEANLAAKDDSPPPPPLDGSKLLRFEEVDADAESLMRETDRLCGTCGSDSVEVDESVDVLQLRAMLRTEALRDGM